ncbi:DUF2497 domain-containing protein [Emcibacteraceae bacterium]|nr:DUF2497 domain-containing protein [Emcibacteraceae bacterium]
MKSRNNDEEQSMEEILASIRRIISEDDKNVKLDDVIDLHPNRETLDPEFTDTKIDENVLHLTEDDLEVTSDNSSTEKIISDEISAEVKNQFDVLSKLLTPDYKGSDVKIDTLVSDLLRPMLKQWLEKNLPSLVKKMVSKEISRLIETKKP